MKSLLCLFLCLLSLPALAGSIAVYPVQVQSRGTPKIAVITFKNGSSLPTRYQVEVRSWTQFGGKNIYKPTHDLLVSPPLLPVPGKTTRIVRVLPTHALLGPHYYVLFFRQLDSVMSVKQGGATLHYLINQALKASYEPADASPAVLTARDVEGHLELVNSGGSHAAVISIGEPGMKPMLAGALGWVLPGSAFDFVHASVHKGEAIMVGLEGGKSVNLTVQ